MYEKFKATLIKSLKFYAVGGMGIIVQLTMIHILHNILKVHYLVATSLGVEAAVIQNYIWHEKWTWADRASGTMKESAIRLLKFNITTGLFSLLGNLALMRFFVGFLKLPVVRANILTLAMCAILNFVISHYYVFKPQEDTLMSAES